MLLLELLIVAAGVFLGFQVDRWYEQAQNSERTEQYLQRLLINVESDIESFEQQSRVSIDRRESTERVILSVDDDFVVVEDPNRYLSDIRRATMRFTAIANDMTYQELQSTGDMSLLPIDVREELYAYYNDIESFSQFSSTRADIQSEGYTRFAGILLPEQFNLTMPPPEFSRELNYSSDEALAAADRLRNNTEAVNWLGRLRDSQVQSERSALRFLRNAENLKTILQENLD